MRMTQDFETNLAELLARYINEKYADASFRSGEQDAELKRLKCSNPELGRWVDGNDFPFLIETLMLNDAVFSREYPGLKLSAEERRRFAHELEEHCEGCDRCSRKRATDLDWQASVNRALAESKEAVGEIIARAAAAKQ